MNPFLQMLLSFLQQQQYGSAFGGQQGGGWPPTSGYRGPWNTWTPRQPVNNFRNPGAVVPDPSFGLRPTNQPPTSIPAPNPANQVVPFVPDPFQIAPTNQPATPIFAPNGALPANANSTAMTTIPFLGMQMPVYAWGVPGQPQLPTQTPPYQNPNRGIRPLNSPSR